MATAAAVAILAAVPVAGWATSLPERTFPVSPPGIAAGTDAVVSNDGGSVVFDAGGNIFLANVLTGADRLISGGPGAVPGNGLSAQPAVSADGSVVAFASAAANLTGGDVNGMTDVFVRAGSGDVETVSVAADGGPANGASSQPALSADGRYVVFTSTASNLVAGDGNGLSDVFLRDRQAHTTVRVSVGRGAVQANGPSSTPAISGDGRVISFASAAGNLVASDRNRVPDVFVRVPSSDTTALVSVSGRGQPQNAAVGAAFTQISSLSGDGRLVAFDSNATNLVAGEDPRARTNVFVRDRTRRRTVLVSQGNAGFEGNNDSFAPYITPSGLYVTFESFARNLAPGGGPRENVFVRDLSLSTTAVVDVAPGGSAPGPEAGGQVLERPTLSGDGSVATFSSTASNLTAGTKASGVFLRLLAPPRGLLRGAAPRPGRRPSVSVGADDPAARSFECRIDHRLPFTCAPGRLRLPALPLGVHSLLVRAGGPGMLYDPLGLRVTLRVTARG
ncbi:MAG: TolB family protein [Solirubrobacteraceae bacterium]